MGIQLLLTIIFGISGTIITVLVINKPKLKCYQIFPGKLFSDEINDISKLEIRYNTHKIEGELIFLQILINNEGNCDIDSNDIYEPVTITYNEPLKIIDAFIDKKTVNVDLDINKNCIHLKWDLLKKNEYFIVNIILNHSDENKLKINNRNLIKKYTTINSRIKNIEKIKKESYLKIITNRDKLFFILLLSSLFFLLLSQSSDTIKINKKQRERESLYKSILETINDTREFNKNVLNYNEKVREFIENQQYANNETIDLLNMIINTRNDINIDEVKNKIIEIKEILGRLNKPEIDFDFYIDSVSMPIIDNDKHITIIDIDGLVIFYLTLSLIIFLFDIYQTINYLRTRKIEKYLKCNN